MTTVGMVLFPRLTQLDLTGPYEVFARLPDTRVLLLAAGRGPVASEHGLAILPGATFDEAPPLDVLLAPGGPGVGEGLEDDRLLNFLRRQGGQARWVVGVCTGSLLLGAAGLLRGCRAATHWLSMDLLPLLGAVPVAERVVRDRNRITGGGVTAGIDIALTVAALLHGEAVAREVQLRLEYDPRPPFASGSPRTADADTVRRVAESRRSAQEQRRRAIERLTAAWAKDIQ
jgi:cyclohexyl-isocyanide hydratase